MLHYHYLSLTDSIKPSLLFSSLDAVFLKDRFIRLFQLLATIEHKQIPRRINKVRI